jgi:hypothetical protein
MFSGRRGSNNTAYLTARLARDRPEMLPRLMWAMLSHETAALVDLQPPIKTGCLENALAPERQGPEGYRSDATEIAGQGLGSCRSLCARNRSCCRDASAQTGQGLEGLSSTVDHNSRWGSSVVSGNPRQKAPLRKRLSPWRRGLSSNGAENWVKASSLLDRLSILLKKKHI